MSYQRVLEEVERQIEQVESFRESMMHATYKLIKQIESQRSAYEKMTRQIERAESFRESMMHATYESIRQIDLERSAYEEMMRQMGLIDSVREEIRRQSELMMPAVNMLLEYARLKNAKSVDPNTSDYCREWNWELCMLTDRTMSRIISRYNVLDDGMENGSTSSALF